MTADSSLTSPNAPSRSRRQRLSAYLNEVDTPIGVGVNLAIAALILLSSGIFVAETYPLPTAVQKTLDWLDISILVIFAGEYLLRLWCAEARWAFVRNPYALLDLLAIVPFLIGFFDIRFIRLLRWFRVLRLFRILKRRAWMGLLHTERGIALARILFTLFAIIFVYSGLIYQVEHAVNPTGFRHFGDAFYFSTVTMTTVGYGDVTPISQLGRLLTVFMILTGVALIPWQLGEFIQQVLQTSQSRAIACSRCGLARHDADALCCKHCGATLPIAGTAVRSPEQSPPHPTESAPPSPTHSSSLPPPTS